MGRSTHTFKVYIVILCNTSRVKVLDNFRQIVENVIQVASVFEKNSVLNLDYVPRNLPHRESQVRELTINFRDILFSPGSVSSAAVITGKPGSGKTTTVRKFGETFSQIARDKNVKLYYTHINCHRQRTLYLSLLEIARQLNFRVPNRGLSAQETFRYIYDNLEKRNIQLIVALDEFDYFVSSVPPEDIYFLVRVYDELNVETKRIHYIFIVRDKSTLSFLDKSIREHIMKSVIDFPPYSSAELYDILKQRVVEEKAFREGAVGDETLKSIADLHGADKGGSGNARLAIETLELAGKIAESEGSLLVTADHVEKAFSQINPDIAAFEEIIKDLDLQSLMLLKAVADKGGEDLPIGVVEEQYKLVAKKMGETPRSHTQVYDYIRRMKLLGLLTTKQSGKGMRGRTTLISLSIPFSPQLEDLITRELQGRKKL